MKFKNEVQRDAVTGLRVSGPCLMTATRSHVERGARVSAGVAWVARLGAYSLHVQYDRQRSRPREFPVWGEVLSWSALVQGVEALASGEVDAAIARCGRSLEEYGLKPKQVERATRALRREARLAAFYMTQRADPAEFDDVAARRAALRDIAGEARRLLAAHFGVSPDDLQRRARGGRS